MIDSVRRRRARSDAGFTLIELAVAMFLTLLVVSALTGVFISSLSGIALAKQRQAATALATGTMEQFRAVDYGTLSAGLTCSDLAGDSRVALSGICAAGVTGTFTAGVAGIVEPLVIQVSGPAAAPLNPHRLSKTLENVTYQVDSYVSKASAASSSFNLTVLVQWTSNVSRGTKTVVQRSVAFSPSRCLSSATHPYAGACQSSFNGDAGLTKAGIVVVNADDGTAMIPGFDGKKLDLTLNGLSSTLNAEQVTKLTAFGTTSGVDTVIGAVTTAAGGATGSVAADTDPSSTSTSAGTASLNQGSTSALSLAGTGGTLSLVPTTTDSGGLDARATSTSTSCLEATGLAVDASNRPCAWGRVQPTGSSAALSLNLPNGAPNFTLATLAAAPSAARSVVARLGTGTTSTCTGTSSVGCVTAQATRALGTVSLGRLPSYGGGSDLQPASWPGAFITVTNLVETARAEVGVGVGRSVFTRTSGSVSYYDGATSTVKSVPNLTTMASDFVANLGTVSGTYVQGGRTTVVQMTGSLRAGAAAPLPPDAPITDAACKTAACQYSATPASTLKSTITYSISIDGVPVTKFAVITDLGAVLARSSYKAAFDA